MEKITLFFSILFMFFFVGHSTVYSQCTDLYIEGLIDGPLTGGTPKALQLCANTNIPDLSIYGVESVSNSNSSAGAPEFNFPADALSAGDCIWVTANATEFNSFFGFSACYVEPQINSNGDDDYLLYCNGALSDVHGVDTQDGTGFAWDYLDGWGNRIGTTPNPVFTPAEWTHSGPNALDGETTNATAAMPYPNTMINCPMAADVILISEVSLCTQELELQNVGTTTVDISTWRLCVRPVYDAINSAAVTVVSGSTTLAPGDFVVLNWTSMVTAGAGEIGLYLPTGLFTDPMSVIDYVVYNGIPALNRATVAVAAGVWDNATLSATFDAAAGCSSAIANGTNPLATNSSTWCTSSTNTLTAPNANSACQSNIMCPAVGDLIITEIMYDPIVEPAQEWFEVCNTTAAAIDMQGFEIGDATATNHIISTSVIVPAGGCIVISHTDAVVCGGAATAYQHGSFVLNQGGDDVEIICNGTTIDIVTYGGAFPDGGDGEGISFDPNVMQNSTQNDIAANWCLSTTACGSDFGTPGIANASCVATCGVTFLANPNYTCATLTGAADVVTVDINYGGSDPSAVLSILVNGAAVTNGGDNPQSVSNGTISFMAMEGDVIVVTFTDPLCMNLIINTTISGNQCPDPALCTGDLYINGAIDGPLGGGTPKGVQLCAINAIPDLSIYGIESVTNGAGSGGAPEYTFPAAPLGAGECIWLATESTNFNSFFGFNPCYTSGVVGINGDDALLLYCANTIVDLLGDPNCDPNSAMPDCGGWEYLDGWAFANDNVPSSTFNELEWTFSGENVLDGEMTNATAATPYPNPGMSCPALLYGGCPDDYASGGLANSQAPLTGLQDVTADYEADGDIISDQLIGSVTNTIMVDYDSATSVEMISNFEVVSGVMFHAFIDGCGGSQ